MTERADDRLNGGKPIVLSPEEHERLNEMRKKIDPAVLKRIEALADAEYHLLEGRNPLLSSFSASF